MKTDTFLLTRGNYAMPFTRINLDRQTCLNFASMMNDAAHFLSNDLRKWADTAKHGDMFVLNADYAIVAMELDMFWPFTPKGPGKLWKQNEETTEAKH